ncbi:MAG: hypothetical protein OEO79_13710 [Gemmatimonadota bacterium]|nr:hypothetical protein [Gemmatimonadota bacterium]MDH3423300.1 hypothetical protein [Gemmatimonadota bacterium]
MRKLIAIVVWIPLQIAFIPLAIVGVVITTYKQLVVSKRLGVSATGIEVIQGRWTMHWFGIRRDEPTARLAGALPNATKAGLWLVLFPLWVAQKLSGTTFLYPRVPVEGNARRHPRARGTREYRRGGHLRVPHDRVCVQGR